jgi:hypothetical protein
MARPAGRVPAGRVVRSVSVLFVQDNLGGANGDSKRPVPFLSGMITSVVAQAVGVLSRREVMPG